MRTGVVVLLCSILAGCAAAPSATPSTAPPTAVVSPSASAATPSATESPSLAASPSPAPAFITTVPTDPATAWSGIVWRKLAADDPLGDVRSIVRWRGGYVAVGAPVAAGPTSSTPVWVSSDGGTWRRLDPDVLGPAAMVLGVGETPNGLVALTLQGGADACDGNEVLDCWTLAQPLQSWTSSDGISWTAHPGPDVPLHPMFEGGGLDAPIFRAGAAGLLVVAPTDKGFRTALSRDGVAWQTQPADALPAGFEVGDVAAFGNEFVAVGQTAGDQGRATALTSSDGRTWAKRSLPLKGIDQSGGTNASQLVVGPKGLIAVGSDGLAPGTSIWWGSPDGQAWTQLAKYPPLGVWTGEGEGSGLIANGTVVGKGDRMLAYRGGAKQAGWTSSDGRSWQRLSFSGAKAPPVEIQAWRQIFVLPIGVVWVGDDGAIWFGEPVTG